jgi:hypothetical protein
VNKDNPKGVEYESRGRHLRRQPRSRWEQLFRKYVTQKEGGTCEELRETEVVGVARLLDDQHKSGNVERKRRTNP